MRRLGIVSLGVWLGLATVVAAQPSSRPLPSPQACPPQAVTPREWPVFRAHPPSHPPSPFPHDPQLPPPPVAGPDSPSVLRQQQFDVLFADSPAAEEPNPPKVQHLLKAAKHLDAAGFRDHARLLRRIARQEQTHPRVAKQLKRLKAEIRRLRGQANTAQQIMLHVQVVELSRTKLRKLGIDFDTAGVIGRSGRDKEFFHCHVIKAEEKIGQVIESLRAADSLKVIASPTLVTTSGRTASFWSGGEYPVAVPKDPGETGVEYKKFGTSLEFVPVFLKSGKVRLEVRHRVSTIDRNRSVQVGRHSVPGLRVHEMDTAVELGFGQTLVLARAGQTPKRIVRRTNCTRGTDKSSGQTDVLVLITPERVDPIKPLQPTAPLAEKPEGTWWERFFLR